MKWKIASILLAGIAGSFFCSHAFALTPSTSATVSKVDIELPYSYNKNGNTVYIGKSECQRLVRENSHVKLTYTTLISPLTPGIFDSVVTFRVQRDSTARIDCSGPPPSLCTDIDPMYITKTAKNIVVDIAFKTLLNLNSPTDCDTLDTEFFVRARMKQRSTDTVITDSDAKFIINAIGPNPPTLDSASATESSLVVTLSGTREKNIENFAAFYSETPLIAGQVPDPTTTPFALFGSKDIKQASMKVSMVAGKKYSIGISSHDDTGNYGPLSNLIELTPIKTTDFWEAYLLAGGSDEGGCSTTSTPFNSTPFQLLVLGAISLIFRRRRHPNI